jgi:hypothetical protein
MAHAGASSWNAVKTALQYLLRIVDRLWLRDMIHLRGLQDLDS